jgi:glycosyltransferase involved in cell wall biosynthesis
VPTVLHVIDGLDYAGPARQLVLLATGQHRAGHTVHVCLIGGSSLWSEALQANGVTVTPLGRRWPFDLYPFLALARKLRTEQADVILAWGPLALRTVATLRRRRTRLVACAVLPPLGSPPFLDCWILRNQVDGILAFGSAEAARYLSLGVPANRLIEARPAVELPTPVEPAFLPGGGRVILTVGPLERHKGIHDAIWALDILHYLYEDLRLVIAGTGSDRGRVEAFCHSVGVTSRVHFLGVVPDLRPWFQRAELVWVPTQAGGVNAALEAQASARPVVAGKTLALAKVVVDGETGALFRPGDKPALARQTRVLLDDRQLAQRQGQAGRQRAAELFHPEQLRLAIDRWCGF